ncbi:DciA family protein [Corynebacterium frankenforstense]|uniref:DciA family protein n=1 Tax=Corynebacterium frankenforstense TaxID=1230998 RepID=UPI0025514945|nr:DciA family protein [Corynebacterium frankenforstense]MDK6259545.1 DciA family protein [Corynebacterium frankenforstense]
MRDSERENSAEPQVGGDIIAEAFGNLRRRAGAGNRHAPSLKFQANVRSEAKVPGLKEPERTGRGRRGRTRRQRGIPTGADGYIVQRRRDVDNVGSLLSREMHRRGWTGHLADGWVSGHWEELVGEKIAQHTRVEMIKETTVFISCDSTSWATNLRYLQRQILQEIARKVGPNVITQLKIFGPKAPSWRKGPLHVKGRGPRDTYG